MKANRLVMGIDVGSVALAAVVVAPDGTVRDRYYAPHGGDIEATLRDMSGSFAAVDDCPLEAVALTGRNARKIRHDRYVDSRLACIRSVKARYPEARAILLVGGEFFSLIEFDAEGRYHGVRSNTSCAAGTGSFLDQQAGRLNLAGSAELSATALGNEDAVPLVATRCAVFAKTDLIHAQQAGHSVSGIAEGLCTGLAHNLVDTLFKDSELSGPIVFTGGVSQNEAVVRQVAALVEHEIIVDELGAVQGALGAALSYLDEIDVTEWKPWRRGAPGGPTTPETADGTERPVGPPPTTCSIGELFVPSSPDRSDFYPPLTLSRSTHPDFSCYRAYDHPIEGRPGQPYVEVSLYEPWGERQDVYLGIDIGSTSTKAVVTDLDGRVLGGFYTRTSGRPLEATQALCEAIDRAAEGERCELAVQGSATTGSGRKFIGGIIAADEVLDEISAHARAATELDPAVDTILEIGGQDAKFTTLRNGRVTLSVMNNVCAAGTGSFLEEQAQRLGVAVEEFAMRTEGVRAPRVSDRCTVFMERDINHLLSEGHTTEEVLAAALHAVRENYLHKVAIEKNVGEVVFFQGATAKNRSLVAAFEQRLNRPILVSPYCHLTGALGAALTLRDGGVLSDRFVGVDLYRRAIPVRREVCTLCASHCKLTVAEVDGRTVAYGFLCGRDYDTESYVNRNTSGFDLIKARRALEREILREVGVGGVGVQPNPGAAGSVEETPLIGLPHGLFMAEDLSYWEVFFRELGLRTASSRSVKNPIARGKPLAGADFCAPVSALHGHVAALLESVDYLFLPHYLERKPEKGGGLRKFCYYSQFAPAFVAQALGGDRIVSPLVGTRFSRFHLVGELHKALASIPGARRGFTKIAAALDRADEYRRRYDERLKALYRDNRTADDTVDVVLLGRPYSVLGPEMNKGIPEILASLGIRVFYQDQIEYRSEEVAAVEPLLKEVNWSYGAKILEVTEVVAHERGLYPVFLTSFKCGPDSFISDYVKRILDARDKPYLVLELDEHDSSVGYETRIEAAVRSFRNHLQSTPTRRRTEYRGLQPRYSRDLPRDKWLVLPNWDDYSIPLIAAILNGQRYRALAMEETEGTIRKSLRWNNGQCIPMNALVEGYVATIRNHDLEPADCLLWIPSADFSCNIRLFPHHIREILSEYGEGMENAGVYQGLMTYTDISPIITANAYLAFMFAGLIRRIACRIRPYEIDPGATDRAVDEALAILTAMFRDPRASKVQAVQRVIDLFEPIRYDNDRRKPKVALFGDVYVRDNPVMNQDVIKYIEANGGEVVTMPFHEFTRMTVNTYFHRWVREGKLGRLVTLKPMLAALVTMEKWYYRHFEQVIGEPAPQFLEDPADILAHYGVRVDHEGESQDNLLKTWYIKKQHPDLTLFVQLNPGFCCAGLVTEAMTRRIREITGVPVLSITYDGTGGLKNDLILPYLASPPTAADYAAAELRPPS